MPKQKINAMEFISDIRAGMDDTALMRKYGPASQGLQSVFQKLVAAKALKQAELDERASLQKRTVDIVWKCPACGKPQTRELDACPDCGVIVSKFRKQKLSTTFQNSEKAPPESLGVGDLLICSYCGQKCPEHANFCPRCGNKLKIAAGAESETGQSSDRGP